MKTALLPLGRGYELSLPDCVDVYAMRAPTVLSDPAAALREELARPRGTRPFADLARAAASKRSGATAAVVVSDNTRPVPYRGEAGILLPLVRGLLGAGFEPSRITVIVATGTHRAMEPDELEAMIDPAVFASGVRVANHDCRDAANLVSFGETARGTRIEVNRTYAEADFRVLTGLVESHFMAGASGGRKSVCPGLVGERSTFVFHGPAMMAHPGTRDLNLDGNPCHEEALEVARRVGADFIVNATLDHSFRTTGVFAGGLEEAHAAAVDFLKGYVGMPVDGAYDVVLSHAGFVGVNHYQAAKAAVASLGVLAPGGFLAMAADNKDPAGPVGSINYRTVLQLLKLVGPEAFERLILSPDWAFVPEQWQVQMWTKVFARIPFGRFCYFAPQLGAAHWEGLPGVDGRRFLAGSSGPAALDDAPAFLRGALDAALAEAGPVGRRGLRAAYLQDGPYGIPYAAASRPGPGTPFP